VPLVRKFDPALQLFLDFLLFVQNDDRNGEEKAQKPGTANEDASSSPASGEVHWVRNGVVAIYAESHKHIG
jgi:hypothetical protein